MRATVRVVWLKNHGVRIITTTAAGESVRFEAHAGSVTVAEACAALKTYPVKLYRLVESYKVKAQARGGVTRIPVAELWRLKRDPAALKDGRRPAKVEA